jgi:hypothetical protein
MILYFVLDSSAYLGENFAPVLVLYIGFALGKFISLVGMMY